MQEFVLLSFSFNPTEKFLSVYKSSIYVRVKEGFFINMDLRKNREYNRKNSQIFRKTIIQISLFFLMFEIKDYWTDVNGTLCNVTKNAGIYATKLFLKSNSEIFISL